MAFDWDSFFRQEGIEYRTEGKNVKKGWCNLCCPYCGNDSGFHMGCNPATGGFACWRDRGHSGRNPAKLIMVLKGCSWGEAVKISGGDEVAPGPGTYEDLEREVAKLDEEPARAKRLRLLSYPPAFRRIVAGGVTEDCWEHLVAKRKFREGDVRELCDRYLLRYAPFGEWKRRIILPFLHKERTIIGWQGRAIEDANLRYISYPKEAADKRLLFNFGPALSGGKVLSIVEGPFDCIKMDFYGRRAKFRTVGTLGTSYTEDQVGLIYRLAPLYDQVLIFFDPDAMGPAMALQSRLSRFHAKLGFVPPGRDDPGDLDPGEVVPLIKTYA